jgi:superfamily I DNA/RNA helicase
MCSSLDPPDTAPVQVMNLHQTKGNEVDAVIIVFREDDYHGNETEPFPGGQQAPVRDPHPRPPSRHAATA